MRKKKIIINTPEDIATWTLFNTAAFHYTKQQFSPLPLLFIAVSGRLWLCSIAAEGPIEKRGGTVRHVVGKRVGT